MVKAVLPSESCMSSMMREVAMSRFGHGVPKMWQFMNLRPGTQVEADTEIEGNLSIEQIDDYLKEFSKTDPELAEQIQRMQTGDALPSNSASAA